ncbi:hypothetical protein A9975_16690 [Cupriavidus sp. UME77]|nr:hypothetical protein [Cupriavidus sp. UME77]
MVLSSCDADGLRASERCHAVQHAEADRHLGGRGPCSHRPTGVAGKVSAHQSRQRLRVIQLTFGSASKLEPWVRLDRSTRMMAR